MKLQEILTENKKKGTYAGVRFNKDTINAITEYCKKNKIPNPTDSKELHTTLLYSRKHLPEYTAAGTYEKPMIATPIKFMKWNTRSNSRTVLVLRYKCPELTKRHKKLMDEHKAQYDFNQYLPHITFAEDVGDFDISELPEFNKKIIIVEEYQEDLDD